MLKLLNYMPSIINEVASNRFIANMEFCVSNTQGAREPIYFDDRVIHDILAWGPQPAKTAVFMYVNSYNNTTKVHFTFDKNVTFDPKDFVRRVETIIDSEIEASKK